MAGKGSNAIPPTTSTQSEFQSGGEKTVGTMLCQTAERVPPQPQRLPSGVDTVVRHRMPQSEYRLESLFPSNRIGQSPTIVLRKYRSPAKDKRGHTRRSGKVEESPAIHLNLACSQNEVNQLHSIHLHHDILRTHASRILQALAATHRPRRSQ